MITVSWDKPVRVGTIVLKENILRSQRVEAFPIEALEGQEFWEVYRGTVIGYKRIVSPENLVTSQVRIIVDDCRCEPVLSLLGIYQGS